MTPRWYLATLAVLALGACTTDKIVYRSRPPFNPPADSLSGFLGYFDVSTKQTTCGNCHVDHQTDWKQTHHANAWADLQASGHATSDCEPCHTVSQNGNIAPAPAGYSKIADSAYQDVQCESCHGPGFAHVLQPDQAATKPLAHISLADTTASCASCHTGVHNPFFDEWKQSRHSQIVTSAASNPACASCHDGKQTLLAWGVTGAYAEQSQPGPEPVDCAVCHNPHGSPNEHQLRFSARNPAPAQNLCMQCHLNRFEPAGGSSYGTHPHAPQGAVLLGIAGYRPPGFAFDTTNTLVASHGPGGNPNLCAGCHVYRFTITDPATGAFQFQATGHLFRPLPCYDPSTGYPTANNNCAYDVSARSFKACAQSGCHADEATAQGLLELERSRIQQLVDVLWKDVNGNQVIDAFPTDSGYLPKIKLNAPGEFAVDSIITPAEGAEFNARLTGEGLDGNGDKSKGVHNPFLYEALLRASISDLEQAYPGFLPAPPAAAQQIMDHPVGGTTRVAPRPLAGK